MSEHSLTHQTAKDMTVLLRMVFKNKHGTPVLC